MSYNDYIKQVTFNQIRDLSVRGYYQSRMRFTIKT